MSFVDAGNPKNMMSPRAMQQQSTCIKVKQSEISGIEALNPDEFKALQA